MLVMLIFTQVFAREPHGPKTSVRVALQVSGYDPVLIDRVSAVLTNELRVLKGITVVDADPNLCLRIVVVENRIRFESAGYTLSVLASTTIPHDYLGPSVPDEARRAFLVRLYRDAEKVADHWIVSTPPGGLDEGCRKLVASFYQTTFLAATSHRPTVGEVVYATKENAAAISIGR